MQFSIDREIMLEVIAKRNENPWKVVLISYKVVHWIDIDFTEVQSKYRIIGKRFTVRLNILKTQTTKWNVLLTFVF